MPASPNPATTDLSNDSEIVITRLLNAPRELAFSAWTDPEKVVKWWGPNGFSITIERMDVRPGGVWKYVMHGPDGVDYPNKTVYEEIVPPELLSYSHSGGDPARGERAVLFHSTVTFVQESDQTRITLRMKFKSPEDRTYVIEKFGAVEGGVQHVARLNEFLLGKL
ncbi:MAG: ATPase [Pirellula sp.]|nr:ATPase [Pirellula sp.]